MKKCSRCKVLKITSCYTKDAYEKDGLDKYCRDCKSIKNKKFRITRPEVFTNWIKENSGYMKDYIHSKDNGLLLKYKNMLVRCSEKSISSKYYFEKGIKVMWCSYDEFKKDMEESYIKHVKEFGKRETSLDRIDSDKNYCKENCRWVTLKEQANNAHESRRKNKLQNLNKTI